MTYVRRFQLVEDYLVHLDIQMNQIRDPFVQSRYLGFVAVSAVTVYELAIKDIFYNFSDQKHSILGEFARANFVQMNGRIKINSLRSEHIKMFGDKYVKKFDKLLEKREAEMLRAGLGSPGASYGNIIAWRHVFVHQGNAPTTTNYDELKRAYSAGKEVIHCLSQAMRR